MSRHPPSEAQPTSPVAGGLLAGGQSRRMGRTKAAVPWKPNTTMGESALDALAKLTTDVWVLGHGEGIAPDVRRLDDWRSGGGPLTGIESLLHAAPDRDSVVVTCDMPLVTGELLARLPEAPRGGVSLFDDGSGDTEPFPMRLSASALAALTAWLDNGRRDVRGFVATLPRHTTSLDGRQRKLLLNVNRPPDLVAARQHAENLVSSNGDSDELHAMLVTRQIVRLRDGKAHRVHDFVAVEAPLELQIGTVPIAVVMRTPGHDEELALGFLKTEGIIANAQDLVALRHCTDVPAEAVGNVITATPGPQIRLDLASLRRNFFVGSSCGVCGKATIDAAMAHIAQVPPPTRPPALSLVDLSALPAAMLASQTTFARTGGVHAAALFDEHGLLLVVREDVGRHNALDKVVGWSMRNGLPETSQLIVAVSGRVSFEVVQKAAAGGIGIIVAVSAPTSLALDLAQRVGVCVVGFARDRGANVYTHKQRIRPTDSV